MFDVIFVVGVSVLVLPLVVLLAALIAADGGNPFYVQRRVGKNGRIFRMVKLRSMVVDADRKLLEHLKTNAKAREEWALNQKLRDDPRVTKVGSLIRKCSLDELPQFWNVLRGEMSVVGPRPMMPSQRHLYPGQAYFALKPGVTGFWQITDRNSTSFAARARYDADYYSRVSFWTDLKVILNTVRVVLKGTGF